MDDLAQFNKARWEALAAANILYSRPKLDLDPASARALLDPLGLLPDDLSGSSVLCLASGGGRQSAAFALLGASVTVLDLSETQLQRDRTALDHYGLDAQLEQGDMRDLSRFPAEAFDIVWQPYSINFVPEVGPVFDGVARALRTGGLYHVEWGNPFICDVDERHWSGSGYTVSSLYADGAITFADDHWDVYDEDGTLRRVEGPREFNHTMSTMLNALAGRGFALIGMLEGPEGDPEAAPGSWEHFVRVVPPWLALWLRFLPDVLGG